MPCAAPDPSRGYQRRLRRKHASLLALCGLAAGLALLDTLTGPAGLGLQALRDALLGSGAGEGALRIIVWELRLPQAIMALSIGASLGLAGAEMQTVLDNPLASPFTLGISSAAALGAAVALLLDPALPGIPHAYVPAVCAFAFALCCTWLLDLVARKTRLGATSIVLFGIALVFSFNAVLTLLQFSVSASALQDLIFWMMGSLARADWPDVAIMSAALLAAAPFALRSAWQLTALRFGEARAVSFGVDTRRVRRASLLRVSLLASLAVSLAGVIGFVGLVAPHIARNLWGEDHRWYLPASALVGGIILSGSAIVSKLLSGDAVLPVGIVTTLVGIPFFLLAILRRQTAH